MKVHISELYPAPHLSLEAESEHDHLVLRLLANWHRLRPHDRLSVLGCVVSDSKYENVGIGFVPVPPEDS